MPSSSKTLFFLLCLLFALVLITSSVDAKEETNGVEESKYGGGYGGGPRGGYGGGGRCRHGCCRGYRYKNGCRRCCANANEAPDSFFEDDPKH